MTIKPFTFYKYLAKLYESENKNFNNNLVRCQTEFDFKSFKSINDFDVNNFINIPLKLTNQDIKPSHKFVFICPYCEIQQTSSYEIINKFKRFCFTKECKYYLEGRTIFMYDIAKLFMEKQLVLLSDYKNRQTQMDILCLKCNDKIKLSLKQYLEKYECQKCMILNNDILNKKNICYKTYVELYGYKIVGTTPTKEIHNFIYECEFKHQTNIKFCVFKERVNKNKELKQNNLLEKDLCDECEYIKWFNKYVDILKNSGIETINTVYKKNFDNKINISEIKFEYKCPMNLHKFEHTIGRIKEIINDNGYRCFICEKDGSKIYKLIKIKNKCTEKGFELINFNKNNNIIEFKCVCGIVNNRDYKSFIKKKYNGCNMCARKNPISTFNQIYGNNFQKCEKYKLINEEEIYLQSSEGFCFDYLLKQYNRKDLVISMELFYKYVNKVKNLLSKDRQNQLENLNIKLPIIYYDIGGNSRCYYPDGYIISTNTVIECKTYSLNEKYYRKIFGCLSAGFNVISLRYNENQIYKYVYETKDLYHFDYIFNKCLVNKEELKDTKIKIRPPQINIKARPICMFDKNMNYIETFKSLKIAMGHSGDSENWILKCCENKGIYEYKKKHTNKYYWKYKIDYDKEQENYYEFEFID